jgi:hypothetical protein
VALDSLITVLGARIPGLSSPQTIRTYGLGTGSLAEVNMGIVGRVSATAIECRVVCWFMQMLTPVDLASILQGVERVAFIPTCWQVTNFPLLDQRVCT